MLVPELLQENANSESILFELEQLVFHTDLVAIQNKFKRLSHAFNAELWKNKRWSRK